jgi:glycosyltransferase involved in cell wall biosynthesis
MKYISIIIPAHNEEKVTGKCLKSLKSQKTKDIEIILVNDGSTDRTVEIAKKTRIPDKIINFDRGHSAAFARNAGAKIARGKYLIFLDADQIAEKNFVKKIKQFLQNEEVDATDYLVYSYKPKTIFQKAWSAFRKYHPSVGFQHVIKRKVFKKLHGFNEKIFYYEDDDLKERFLKAGYNFKGPVNAKVYHIEPESWGDFVRQRKWQAKGYFMCVKRKKKNNCFKIFHSYIAFAFMLFFFFAFADLFCLFLVKIFN